MKTLIILGDGMADEPIAELGGKTPLQYADTPAMDMLARLGGSLRSYRPIENCCRWFPSG